MARVLVLLLLAAVASSAAANGHGFGQPPTFNCQQDGYFADHYRACLVYYRCLGGEKTTLVCDERTAFDETKKACLPYLSVSCPYPAE